MEILPQVCGLVGFESDLEGRVQLLVRDPKASVGFDQTGWAAGQRTGWGWHIAGGCTQSGAGTSSAGSHFRNGHVPMPVR